MNRRARTGVTVAAMAALFAPVAIGTDSFPLSTYPMYARSRAPIVSFVTAHGVDAAGHHHPLTLETIGNSDDPLIVAGELRAAIRDGRADRRCREIAERVDDTGIIAVEVVTEAHDVIEHVSDSPSLTDRVVHSRCPVGEASRDAG